MRKLLVSLVSAFAAVSLYGGIAAYILTSANTPASGLVGEIVGIQACSTNATGTAALSSVTTLNVGGVEVAFTNALASMTLVGGVAAQPTNGVFVAAKQRIVVSGSAFPGGAITVWLKQ